MLNYDRFDRFSNIIKFQIYINNHNELENFYEFVRLSKIIFGSSECDVRFDYENIIFLDREYPSNQISLSPYSDIENIFVIIPCLFRPNHIGVQCKLIDHLRGAGCIDCSYNHIVSHQLFPME